MRSPRIAQVLAAIAAACFVFAAVVHIATGQQGWWQPVVLVVSAVLMGFIAFRGRRRLRHTA
jgi:hypothetical protein